MGTCSRCGNPVEFRYVGGRCIPLHIYGSCIGNNSLANDYSGYNINFESTCFSTNCPECGTEVFFIKHNGGSVWVDPPLGPPWYKHACFENNSTVSTKANLAVEYKLGTSGTERYTGLDLAIGIVKSTRVDIAKRFTDVYFETGKQETQSIRLQHNAGFLLGKLCVYDLINAEIFPVEEPSYIFALYKPPAPHAALVDCPECGVKLNPKNLFKHLELQHGINKEAK